MHVSLGPMMRKHVGSPPPSSLPLSTNSGSANSALSTRPQLQTSYLHLNLTHVSGNSEFCARKIRRMACRDLQRAFVRWLCDLAVNGHVLHLIPTLRVLNWLEETHASIGFYQRLSFGNKVLSRFFVPANQCSANVAWT